MCNYIFYYHPLFLSRFFSSVPSQSNASRHFVIVHRELAHRTIFLHILLFTFLCTSHHLHCPLYSSYCSTCPFQTLGRVFSIQPLYPPSLCVLSLITQLDIAIHCSLTATFVVVLTHIFLNRSVTHPVLLRPRETLYCYSRYHLYCPDSS